MGAIAITPPAPLPARRALRYRAEYLGFRLVAALLRAMPVERAADLSGALWRKVAPLMSRHKRALRHLAAAFPDRTEAEREAIALGMWDNLGRVFAEAMHIDAFVTQPERIEVPPETQALLGRVRRGGVLVSYHCANWELLAAASLASDVPLAGLYQGVKNPLVDAWVTGLRAPIYPLGLFAKSTDTPRRLLRILRGGGVLSLLVDLRDARGIPVAFFGRPAPSTTFPALLARSEDVPLLVGRLVRLPGSRFRAELVEIGHARTQDRAADVAATTAAIQVQIEAWIREEPAHWMWAHRRWG
jgi:KDO2-lipid IV(A) lauroyltransferase